MAQPEKKGGLPKPKFVDRPEITETFVDTLGNMTFDGHTVRMDLCIRRFDEIKTPPAGPPTSRSYPVARLILTPEVMVTIANQMNGFLSLMKQKGMVTEEPRVPEAPKGPVN